MAIFGAKGWLLAAALSLLAGSALAEAPSQTLRPESRPAAAASRSQVGTPRVVEAEESNALRRALRPHVRPAGAARRASEQAGIQAARSTSPARASSGGGGGLCGSAALSGRAIGRVAGRGGCGIENAVELTAVHGVGMSQPLTISCEAATVFARWVGDVAIPTVGNSGGGLQRLDVGGYSCRGRNNQSGNKLSEHAKGNAVDVMGFRTRDGTNVSVLNGWRSNRWGDVLRRFHRSACGMFGVVLGPESNRFHRDHLHFDTLRQRNGSYCR